MPTYQVNYYFAASSVNILKRYKSIGEEELVTQLDPKTDLQALFSISSHFLLFIQEVIVAQTQVSALRNCSLMDLERVKIEF